MRGLVDVGLRLLAKPTATPSLSYDEKSMITVAVEVKPRPYAALIENGLLAKAGALLRELLPAGSRLFVITVAPVRRKWGKVLMGSLTGAGFDAPLLEMPEGERFKRLATRETLAEKLTSLGADRSAEGVRVGDRNRR